MHCVPTEHTLAAYALAIDDGADISLLQLLGAPKGQPADQRMSANGSTYADMMTPEGLRQIAGYAQSIGPPLHAVIPWDSHRRLGQPGPLVRDAHAAGLKVFPYTFRPENRFRAAQFRQAGSPNVENEGGSIEEIRAYLDAGIDGFSSTIRLWAEKPSTAGNAIKDRYV